MKLSTHSRSFQLFTLAFFCGARKGFCSYWFHTLVTSPVWNLVSTPTGLQSATCLSSVRFPDPRPLFLDLFTGFGTLGSWFHTTCHFGSHRRLLCPFWTLFFLLISKTVVISKDSAHLFPLYLLSYQFYLLSQLHCKQVTSPIWS